MKLSLIFSFWNEEEVLSEFLSRIRRATEELLRNGEISAYELIFVDDYSDDGSNDFLRREIFRGDIVLVEMARNVGVSECVIAGLEIASGDIAIYMDCDLQDPPEVVPRLVETWLESRDEIDIVHTRRSQRHQESVVKRFVTRLGYTYLNSSSARRLEPEVGDFKLLSRRAIDCLLHSREQLPFTRGLVAQTGLRSKTIEYSREARHNGKAATHFRVGSHRWLAGHLNRTFIAFSDWPLKVVLWSGITLAGFSLLYLFVVLIQKILGLYEPGWPALMAGITFFGAMNLVGIGFLGLYINVIFLEVKDRQLFTVHRVYTQTKISLPKTREWPSGISSE